MDARNRQPLFLLCFCACLAAGTRVHRRTLTALGDHMHPAEHTLQDPLEEYRKLGLNVTDAFPLESGRCGNWATDYAQRHRAIIYGQKSPQQYVVFWHRHNGIADRLLLSLPSFLFALLTGRAWQYKWMSAFHPHQALRSLFINWDYSGPDVGQGKKVHWVLYYSFTDQDVSRQVHAAYHQWLWTENITETGADADVIKWEANRGALVRMATNPYLKGQLDKLGLNQDNIFGCIFDYLYRPNPSTLAPFKKQLQELQDPEVFVIGIQVRLGDGMFDGSTHKQLDQKQADAVNSYMACAEQLEESVGREMPGRWRSVRWLVISDSLLVRDKLAEKFGDKYADKVITIASGGNIQSTVENPGFTKGHTLEGLQTAAAELWMFSLADAHIVTYTSDFGKHGAMLSLKQHIYVLPAVPEKGRERCEFSKPDPILQVADQYLQL